MKSIKRAVIAAMLIAIPAGAMAAESALKEILEGGVLKVGTTGDWNPMTMKDPATNSYKGYDIDVMTQLAKDMGVGIEFVATDWKTLVNGVMAGKYHMTGSASISAKRATQAGFSESYLEVVQVPLVLKKNIDRFKDWGDLDKAGVKVAATLGTTQENYIKQFFPNAEHKIIEAPARDFQEVLSGRADAHITSNIEAATLLAQYPQMAVVPVSGGREPAPLAMLLPQDDQVWINYVNHWVKLQKTRGFFDEVGRKWKLTGE